jgi:hypothetical protein
MQSQFLGFSPLLGYNSEIMMIKVAILIGMLVLAFFIFSAGVITGIGYQGRLEQLSRNLDLSDIISLTVIALLSLALWLSLRNKTQDR